LQENLSPPQKRVSTKRGPKVVPGRAILPEDLQQPSTSTKEINEEDSETSEEEVCEICNLFNLPPRAKARKDELIYWQDCDHCKKWFHNWCLQEEGVVTAEEYCDCLDI